MAQPTNSRMPISPMRNTITVSPSVWPPTLLAKHLNLNLRAAQDTDGNIDESFVTAEDRTDMLVFGPKNPYPNNAVKPNTPLPQ